MPNFNGDCRMDTFTGKSSDSVRGWNDFIGQGGGGGGSLYAGPTQVCDQSASKVRDVVTASETVIAAVYSALAELEKRLDTVLTPEPPTADCAQAPSYPVGSSHLHSRMIGLLADLNKIHILTLKLAQRVEV